jgi:hypothetical protein
MARVMICWDSCICDHMLSIVKYAIFFCGGFDAQLKRHDAPYEPHILVFRAACPTS